MSGSVVSTSSPMRTLPPPSAYICPSYAREIYDLACDSAPLWDNFLPHMQTLVNFVTNTLPRPLLIALCYRLAVLHFGSQILPTIGADSWDEDAGVDGGWDARPVRSHSTEELTPLNLPSTDIQVNSFAVDISTSDLCHCVLASTLCVRLHPLLCAIS